MSTSYFFDAHAHAQFAAFKAKPNPPDSVARPREAGFRDDSDAVIRRALESGALSGE
ncbi:MAG: hypothetical protein Q8R39_00255 [bacterium]|nr:hypothetical protein [bacterium]